MSLLMEKMIRAVMEQSPPACKMDRLCAENAVTAALSVLRDPDEETVEAMIDAVSDASNIVCSWPECECAKDAYCPIKKVEMRAALAALAAHLTGEE